MNKIIRFFVKEILQLQSYFFKATPKELLFDGKKNLISCIGHFFDPAKNPDCLFAYFRGQNNTDDGLYEIYSGLDNIRDINSIISLNGSSKLDIWDGDQCNQIEGASNGELFPPLDTVGKNADSQKTLQFYRSDFCRVFNLTLAQSYIPADVEGSLLVDRFRPEKNTFANATVYPGNTCYRPNSNKTVIKESIQYSSAVELKNLINFLKHNGYTDFDFLSKSVNFCLYFYFLFDLYFDEC